MRCERFGVVVVVVIIMGFLSFATAKIRIFFDFCKSFCVFMSMFFGSLSMFLGCSSIDFGGFCGCFVGFLCHFSLFLPPSWGFAPRGLSTPR